MNDSIRIALLTSPASELSTLVRQYHLNVDVIEDLKEFSASFYRSEPAQALRIAKRAHEISFYLPSPATAIGAWAVGNALLYLERYSEANEFYTEAHAHFRQTGDNLNAARIGVGQVGVLAYVGQAEAALALFIAIEPVIQHSATTNQEDQQRLNRLLMNAAVAFELIGNYEEALALYHQLQEILIVSTNEVAHDQHKTMVARITHNQAYTLSQIGAVHEAMQAYQKAEALFRVQNANVDLARLYINQANLLIEFGHFAEAQVIQGKAYAVVSSMKGMQQAIHRLTILQAQLMLLSKAAVSKQVLANLRRAYRAFARQGPVLEEGLALLLLGRCQVQQQKWRGAQHYFDKAHKLVGKGADYTLEFRILHGCALLHQRQNRMAEAIQFYQQAIAKIEAIRHELRIETFRASFMADKLAVYQDLTALYLQQQQLVAAFQVVESAKARLTAERLAFRLQQEVQNSLPLPDLTLSELVTQLQMTLQQLDALYLQAATENFHHDLVLPTPQRNPNQAIGQLEAKVQTQIEQIQRQQPLLSPLTTGQVVSAEQLQAHLGNAVFVQYYLAANKVCAFLAEGKGAIRHIVLGDQARVEETLKDFRISINHVLSFAQKHLPTMRQFLPTFEADTRRHLQLLYQMLIEPLLDDAPVDAPLIIAPDGLLYATPFHALFDGEQYLLERYPISYTPNATVLDFCLQGHDSPSVTRPLGALLLGYDDARLQAVNTELDEIAVLLPEAKRRYGKDATTLAFLAEAQQQRVIHIAAHACFRTDRPMLSSLQLADRRLTLADIARLRLQAELVTLSACETGVGQMRGSDLVSLASGFLGAGARALLVSLWRVDDAATARLMKQFYTLATVGIACGDALRKAQLALLREGQHSLGANMHYRHPAFWAPFLLLGNHKATLKEAKNAT